MGAENKLRGQGDRSLLSPKESNNNLGTHNVQGFQSNGQAIISNGQPNLYGSLNSSGRTDPVLSDSNSTINRAPGGMTGSLNSNLLHPNLLVHSGSNVIGDPQMQLMGQQAHTRNMNGSILEPSIVNYESPQMKKEPLINNPRNP